MEYNATRKLTVLNKLLMQWNAMEIKIFFSFHAKYAAGKKTAMRNKFRNGSHKWYRENRMVMMIGAPTPKRDNLEVR